MLSFLCYLFFFVFSLISLFLLFVLFSLFICLFLCYSIFLSLFISFFSYLPVFNSYSLFIPLSLFFSSMFTISFSHPLRLFPDQEENSTFSCLIWPAWRTETFTEALGDAVDVQRAAQGFIICVNGNLDFFSIFFLLFTLGVNSEELYRHQIAFLILILCNKKQKYWLAGKKI